MSPRTAKRPKRVRPNEPREAPSLFDDPSWDDETADLYDDDASGVYDDGDDEFEEWDEPEDDEDLERAFRGRVPRL